MRIGLNSGTVVVGAIGDDLRMDYTAMGDTTNLAARMETGAEPGSVLVSENTHRLAREFFDFASLGRLAGKGKQEPVRPMTPQADGGGHQDRGIRGQGPHPVCGPRREMETSSGGLRQGAIRRGPGRGHWWARPGSANPDCCWSSEACLPRTNSPIWKDTACITGAPCPICPCWIFSGPFSASKKGSRRGSSRIG